VEIGKEEHTKVEKSSGFLELTDEYFKDGLHNLQ
jgi:hypothetical protein